MRLDKQAKEVVIITQLAGPVVQGELQVQRVVDTSEVRVPETVASSEKIPFPTGLRRRWKPFGWSESFSLL